jgi:hypothetical protein
VLREFLQAADQKDSVQRARLAQDVQAKAAVSSSAIIREGLPSPLLGFLESADYLLRVYRAAKDNSSR